MKLSPVNLMSGPGRSGAQLVPFFKLVCVYFLAWGAGGASSPSPLALGAKCAPVLSLLLLVLYNRPALHAQGRYARRVALGLALSALGDALLLWPQHFVAGMAAFAGAHVAYLAAFQFRPVAPVLAAACYLATGWYLTLLAPPAGSLRVLIPLYALVLATMAWRGAARGRCAAAGALLFLLSDAILGYSLFGAPVPYKQVWVMSTYYLGQLGIALSALEATPGPAPC